MKKTWIATSLVILSAVAAHPADSTPNLTNGNTTGSANKDHRLGAGIILGEPTGASLKYWLNDTIAIDGAIGAWYNDDDNNDSDFYLHADVLRHNFDLIKVPKSRLPVYSGIGSLMRFRDDEHNQVGVRVPVGLSYMFDDAPIDVFAEIGPAIDMAPNVRGEVAGGIGIRFWF